MSKSRIVAVHLLNDRSGSPLIFKQALDCLKKESNIVLFTATPGSSGFLSELTDVERRKLNYKRGHNKLQTLVFFLISQWSLFCRLLFFLKKTDVVYVNTLLPFGAALAGWFRRVPVVYHIHETTLTPHALKAFLVAVARLTAAKFVAVSQYVAEHYRFGEARTSIVLNTLSPEFQEKANDIPYPNLRHPFTVAMLCSLKAYKGVYHFVNVAQKMNKLRFILVLNASAQEADRFSTMTEVPANCTVLPAQEDTIDVYSQAHVVLNLSVADGWIETFGMTLLEGMSCGRPVICPEQGGVLELVTNGLEGFHIDSRDEEKLISALWTLAGNLPLYMTMAQAAKEKSLQFHSSAFCRQLKLVFSAFLAFQQVEENSVQIPLTGKPAIDNV